MKANLCILVQARIPVELPDGFARLGREKRLQIADAALQAAIPARLDEIAGNLRDHLRDDADAFPCMVERTDDGGTYAVLLSTAAWDAWWNPDRGRVTRPGPKERRSA